LEPEGGCAIPQPAWRDGADFVIPSVNVSLYPLLPMTVSVRSRDVWLGWPAPNTVQYSGQSDVNPTDARNAKKCIAIVVAGASRKEFRATPGLLASACYSRLL
jgi:hypothetical protein